MEQQGRTGSTKNIIFGASHTTLSASDDYIFNVTNYDKIITKEKRFLPPRGYNGLEVEPRHYVDGYSGKYKPDYELFVDHETDEYGQQVEKTAE